MRHTTLLALVLAGLISCAPKSEETTTKGHLRVLVAEAVAPVLIPEVNEFMRLYKENGADVSLAIVESREANRRFVNDTARMIITAIPLTAEEKSIAEKTTDELVEFVLAYDGVAVIVQNENALEEAGLEQIRDVLAGKTTSWAQLSRKGLRRGNIRVVLKDSSDVGEYLRRRLLGGGPFGLAPRWTTSSLGTITNVARDRMAVGFVPLSWIDSAKANVKPLSLAAGDALADTSFKPAPESVGKYYSPHPAYLYLNAYPMKRAIYLYARTARGDFATGFASFLSSPSGQKMFLARGLLPATQKIILKPTE